MNKVCPLFFASAVSEIELECRPDKCAWAYRGGCAVVALAACLDDIARNGVTVCLEQGDTDDDDD